MYQKAPLAELRYRFPIGYEANRFRTPGTSTRNHPLPGYYHLLYVILLLQTVMIRPCSLLAGQSKRTIPFEKSP